jgi:hypothetical protein
MAHLFDYAVEYGVLICKPCAYAIPPDALPFHIASNHADVLSPGNPSNLATACTPRRPLKAAHKLANDLLSQYTVLDPHHTQIPMPSPDTEPIPGLKLHHGLQCDTCGLIFTFVEHQKPWTSKDARK